MRSKALERLSRALITLLGAGLGAALAMLLTPLLRRVSPQIFEQFSNQVLLYVVLALVVLIGGPFALGFWLGGVRERGRRKREKGA